MDADPPRPPADLRGTRNRMPNRHPSPRAALLALLTAGLVLSAIGPASLGRAPTADAVEPSAPADGEPGPRRRSHPRLRTRPRPRARTPDADAHPHAHAGSDPRRRRPRPPRRRRRRRRRRRPRRPDATPAPTPTPTTPRRTAVRLAPPGPPAGHPRQHHAQVHRRDPDRPVLRPEHDVPAHDDRVQPQGRPREDDLGPGDAVELRLPALAPARATARRSRPPSPRTASTCTSRSTRCTAPASPTRAGTRAG